MLAATASLIPIAQSSTAPTRGGIGAAGQAISTSTERGGGSIGSYTTRSPSHVSVDTLRRMSRVKPSPRPTNARQNS